MDLFHYNGKWILLDIKGKMKKGLGVGEAQTCDPLVIKQRLSEHGYCGLLNSFTRFNQLKTN